MELDELPIRALIPELLAALAQRSVTLLNAPPGSGKTTALPPEVLSQPWLDGRKILLLEPRRLAAKAAATRIAWELGEKVGQRAGYRVRMERCVSAQTRIEVVTEGVFLRQLQRDPELVGIGLVIFDEFHERSLDADLSLALVLDVVRGLREDLRLLLMSATLDMVALQAMLPDAACVRGAGISHPVELRYLPREPRGNIPQTVLAGVLRAVRECDDDILVFLPGSGEISAVRRLLEPQLSDEYLILPLFGDLARSDQAMALRKDAQGRRRIVLSTSIAESSLTLEGIGTVVDSGWSRRPQFDPNSGLTRLRTQRLSLASADQRSGRAGRLGPGVCYRLWTKTTTATLAVQSQAEMLSADLAPLVLQLALWGEADPNALSWLDTPPAGVVAQARQLLVALDAIDDRGRITRHGRRMAGMPLHPRLAHMLIKAEALGQFALAADLAALVTERDILSGEGGRGSVDIETRLELLHRWRTDAQCVKRSAGVNLSACRHVVDVSRQLRTLGKASDRSRNDPVMVGALLSYAYPERVAQRRTGGSAVFLLASGRAVRVPDADPLAGSQYLVVANLDAGRVEGRVFLAAPIDQSNLEALHAARIKSVTDVKWDPHAEVVVARQRQSLGAITLSINSLANPDSRRIQAAMLDGIRVMGLDVLPWSRSALELRARVQALGHWRPDGNWPDLSDQALLERIEQWLAPWLIGVRSRQQLNRLDLLRVLKGMFEWSEMQQLDELAPTHIKVPSGKERRLEYSPDGTVILRARIQELFGLQHTPRVCNGEVPVMLHLLSPALRPVQVTQDLSGFWQRTYCEVRRELKGRYPKHYWPENPWLAEATAGVKPGKRG